MAPEASTDTHTHNDGVLGPGRVMYVTTLTALHDHAGNSLVAAIDNADITYVSPH